MMMSWSFLNLFSGSGSSSLGSGLLGFLIVIPLVLFFIFLKNEGVFGHFFEKSDYRKAKEILAEKLVSGDISSREYEENIELLERLDG